MNTYLLFCTMDLTSLNTQALDFHRAHQGKITVAPTLPLTTKEDLALAYTPGVAAVSKAIVDDPNQARSLTWKGRTVAVISDGSAVLGLGNIGPLAALPVMEGKALLFKSLAGVDAVPICLDTQDPDEIVETVVRLAPSFGGINLEDIAAPHCFAIERKLQERLSIPVVHDDQHGTAVVVLAGLINSMKLKDMELSRARIVINGAGAAGSAIAELLSMAGAKHLLILDSKGLIHSGRTDLNEEKQRLLEMTDVHTDTSMTLTEALQGADVFIGVSTGGLLTSTMVATMAKDPVICAMANPVPEIYPDEAKKGGAFIVATGRSDFPNQMNNALVFPGLFKGALTHGLPRITREHLLLVARTLAAYIPSPTRDMIVPDVLDPGVSTAISEVLGSRSPHPSQ